MLADGSNSYLYGLGRLGQAGADGWLYHLGDALGSVRQLADPAGMIAYAAAYQPYGSLLASSGTPTTPYGFTGEYSDPTGLVHLRARYYDPGVGRFITRDPWPLSDQQPMSANGWLYVDANPVNKFDPSGLFTDDQIREYTGFVIEEIETELLMVLRASRFGDTLFGFKIPGNAVPLGRANLNADKHLNYGRYRIPQLMSGDIGGWILTRAYGEQNYLIYHSGGYPHIDELVDPGSPWMLYYEYQMVGTWPAVQALLESTMYGAIGGLYIESKGYSGGKAIAIGACLSFLTGLGQIIRDELAETPGTQEGDEIYRYFDEDTNGQIWEHTVVVRDGGVYLNTIERYEPPWYVELLD